MENFFYGDKFYSELGDLICDLEDEYGENLVDMEDDWFCDAQESSCEPIIKLSVEWIMDRINEERFPEDDDDRVWNKVIDSLKKIDYEAVNKEMPELYYESRRRFVITKQDLIDNL